MSEIRELAMRLSRDIGPTSFPTVTVEYLGFTEDALERLVRAAMREGMMRAAEIASSKESNSGDAFKMARGVACRISNSIRAEADKLEGK